MVLEQNYIVSPLPTEHTRMSYPNMLTPPSSSEDSPQPVYYVASPNATSFQGPESYNQGNQIYAPQISYSIVSKDSIVESMLVDSPRAYLSFIEQPIDKFRFRYKSEMAGTHGSLTGITSDKSRKQTYPTVQLHNCTGTAIVRCSIYQVNSKGEPIKRDGMPHAHRLIMKKGKDEVDDPHDMRIGPEDDYRANFHGMGIIHTAKKNLVSELVKKKTQLKMEQIAREETKSRELTTKENVEIKGLAESESKSINLNIVCLRFDAFINQNGILYPICDPIYSHGINNLKSAQTGDLKIVRLDHCVSEAKGNKEVYILVERVTKKNIKIRFYELNDEGREVWSDYGKFNDLDVHHQYAIVFRTPKYKDQDIKKTVNVFIELVRPSDNARSESRDFRFIPNRTLRPGSKRPRYDYSSSEYESSHMDSNELPVTINNMNIEPVPYQTNSLNEVNSAELLRAMNDINSDEFDLLYQEFQQNCPSLDTDAPKFAVIQAQMDDVRFPHKGNTILDCIKSAEIAQRGISYNYVDYVKQEVDPKDKKMAIATVEELKSYMKSQHSPDDVKKFMDHHLNQNKTNAFHISVCLNAKESIQFLLKIMVYYGRLDLINKTNDEGYTALHLAVLSNNQIVVGWLLKCKAAVDAVDANLNTALHLALEKNASIDILDLLTTNWKHEKFGDIINAKNENGRPGLFIAIEKKNMSAVKLLCMKGANINIMDDKNGYVPLRVAIENDSYEITKYLLSLKNIQPNIKDFSNISPLQAGLQKGMEISKLIEQYMVENNIELELKEEQEDEESDEEIEEMEEEDIKPFIIPPDQLEPLYMQVKNFVPTCLDEIAVALDESGNWGSLAELLSIDHLINSGIIQSDGSISKAVLTYAIETNGDSLWVIRNFLENLDEFKVVQIMDRMVYEISNSTS